MSDFKKPQKEYTYPVQFNTFDWSSPVESHHGNIKKRKDSDNIKRVSLWNKSDLGDKKFLFLDFEYANYAGKKHIYQVGAILYDAATGKDVVVWAEEFKLPPGTEILHFIAPTPYSPAKREVHYTSEAFNNGKKRYFDQASSEFLEEMIAYSDYMVAHNYATEAALIGENTSINKEDLLGKTICTMYSMRGVFDEDQSCQKLSDPTNGNSKGRCTLGNLFYEFFDYSMKKEGNRFSFTNGEHLLELDMSSHVKSGNFSTREITSHDAIFDALMSKGILLSAQKHIPSLGQTPAVIASLLDVPAPVLSREPSSDVEYRFKMSREDASVFAESCINSGKSVDEVIVEALRKANVLPLKVDSQVQAQPFIDEGDIYMTEDTLLRM